MSRTERQELDAIKMELRTMKLREELNGNVKYPFGALNGQWTSHNSSSKGLQVNQEKLDRLFKERENLLETGMYSPSDPLIRQLDKEIYQIQNQK